MSDLGIHLRGLLLRVLLRLNFYNIVGGGSKVVRDSSMDFLSLEISARAPEVFFMLNLLVVIRYFHQVSIFLRSCMESFFGVLLVPIRFPLFLGLQNYWKE